MTDNATDRRFDASSPEAILEALARERDVSAVAQVPTHERIPYLGFLLGTEVYGLLLNHLREVTRLTRIRRVPGAPPSVAGLVNLRGEIICALDLRAILGLPPKPAGESGFLVALRDMRDPIGLVVDAISDIYTVDRDQIEPPPSTWPAERVEYFHGMVRVPEGMMGLLDLRRVVSA